MSSDMGRDSPADGSVRLTVLTVDLADPGRPGKVLFSAEEASDAVRSQAVMWAQAQGYDRAVPTLESTVARPPPASRFALVINEPHSLMIYVAWPWSYSLRSSDQ